MDFDHENSLMLIAQDSLVDWSHIEDFHPDVSQLVSEPYALVPLPDSIDDFDEFSCFCSSTPISDVSQALSVAPYQQYLSYTIPHELQLDGLELDSFLWSIENFPSHCEDIIKETVPGNITPSLTKDTTIINSSSSSSSSSSKICSVNASTSSSRSLHEKRRRRIEQRRTGRSRLINVSFDEMRNYFYMPITQAAKEMSVGLTVLKKRCRELGIHRWPHRKMKSLKSLIHNVQELGKDSSEESIRKEVEMLDMHRRLMEDNPEIELTERTKKLRQACFKANYKRRRESTTSPALVITPNESYS
ncbi:uncharacterized protein [Typha angustifolia]|uniref:uncharacterized protein n=1 Tax=Typha angustifolia TaxID=59011 RepID=UPI003C2EF59F